MGIRNKMNNWEEDKKWSDKFIPEIKQILGLLFICESPNEEDKKHNTDLIVLNLNNLRFACRIRKHDYFLKYKNDFTIRSGRPNGTKTELSKIIEGWGDYFFYGFSDAIEIKIFHYKIINLKEFRLYFMRELYKKNLKEHNPAWKEYTNVDKSSSFFVFDTSAMPKDVIFSKWTNDIIS